MQRRAVIMLLVLLMPFFVSAEWVEISQNYYRKEPFRNAIQLYDLSTIKNDIYSNQSITDHQWSKGYVDRFPNKGNVQRQRIQGGERKSQVKIERNPFHHEDLTTRDTPKRRVQINNMKSENSIRNNIKHESRNNASYIQRIQQSTVKGKNKINDINISGNKLITNKNNNDNKDINIVTYSKKIPTADTFELINPDSDNLPETLQLDVPEVNKVNFQLKTGEQKLQDKNKEISNDEQKYSPPVDENTRNETKNNGMDTLIKLLKIVSQTIQRGTRRSISGKVRYLENLKMSLLSSIEERIESAFPDDTVTRRRRRSSGISDSRGHVEFPSSESALMTISFLTFAVFLIKLVLQVIHTYKAKTMMVTPAVVATVGRAGKIFRNPSNK